MVDERDLILNALQQDAPPKRRKKVMKEIEPSLFDEDDVIMKKARKQARRDKRKVKTVDEWTSTDFLQFIHKLMPTFGLTLERRGLTDREKISKLYDKMVDIIGDNMSNQVLKEYFEWWISVFAIDMHDRPIYINNFMNDYQIRKFCNRFEQPVATVKKRAKKSTPPAKDLDIDSLFKLGGLSMAIMSKGIVLPYMYIKPKEGSKSGQLIISTLESFSKEVLQEAMEQTLSNAPYDGQDKFDFMLLISPVLRKHGITQYSHIKFQDCFT